MVDDDARTSWPTTEPPRGPGPPRWVVAFAMVSAVLLALLVVAMLLFGGGQHGPGRHLTHGAPAEPGASSHPTTTWLPAPSPAQDPSSQRATG